MTLFTVKATFLLYVGIIVAARAVGAQRTRSRSRGIHLPLVPIAAGGVAMVTLGYWTQARGR